MQGKREVGRYHEDVSMVPMNHMRNRNQTNEQGILELIFDLDFRDVQELYQFQTLLVQSLQLDGDQYVTGHSQME